MIKSHNHQNQPINRKIEKSKNGFTLIELLMVIAIIGIISTLAVNKVGGVREASARKVSVANQIAVERAVGSYLAGGGRLNRLDSLVYTQGDATTPWSIVGVGFHCTGSYTNYTADATRGLYLGPVQPAAGAASFREEWNEGVTPELRAVLCPYTLSAQERAALSERLGLNYVMGHNEFAGDPADATSPYYGKLCGDGSYVESRDGKNPNESGCVALATTNATSALTLFAVNPIVEAGRAIYRACGQELLKTRKEGEAYAEADVIADVQANGGPLLAFGLGSSASLVGKAEAGLESAPFATYPSRKYYANYILLIRLKSIGSVVLAEFAGVIDPCGHTVRDARKIIRNL